MITRRRSWLIAVLATTVGFLLFAYDDLLDQADSRGSTMHVLAEILEFILQGPGMGVLAFVFCEYLRLADERVRTERERAHQQRFVVLGRIAASVAHEVRNPLHNIRLLLDELQHESSSVGNPALDARVQSNLDRINRAVELVYQLARPPGRAETVDIGVDVVALTREAVVAERQRTQANVLITLPSGLAAVACPSTTVRIVLDNLLRNATAASKQHVSVMVRPVDQAWEVVVENPGHLPAELLREDDGEPATTSAHGLGLGLFISRQLVRGINGTLTLQQDGGQVRAILRLPVWLESA